MRAEEGKPAVRGRVIYVSEDAKVSHGVWESTQGVFKMTFSDDDSGLVLSGEAIAHFADGSTWKLEVGTLDTFKTGTTIRPR